MRKVIASEFVSLDGVMEAPDRWQFPYFNDEMGEAVGAEMAQADTMLLGRVTYQEFASYWPTSTDEPFASHLNNTPKFVVSRTLEAPLEWQNSTLIKENVAEEISGLKQRPGKDIYALGGATLVSSLMKLGLIDEVRLLVNPLILGGGKALFKDVKDRHALKLIQAKPFKSGKVSLTYVTQPEKM